MMTPKVRFVGAFCRRCGAHSSQVWALLEGTPLGEVQCWKCGHCALVETSATVRVNGRKTRT